MPELLIFAVLCAWEGSQWLLPSLALNPLPFARVSAAVFSCMALALAARRSVRQVAFGSRNHLRLAMYGALALGVPALLLAVAQRYFAAEVATAALAGVPVVIVVVAQVTSASEDGTGEALLPAIAGLAGALLLIPVRLPESSNGWIGLSLDLAATLLAGTFSVFAHRAARTVPAAIALQQIASGNATMLLLASGALYLLHIERLETYTRPTLPILAAALGMDLLTALAATLLLRQMRPLALSSRFLIVPLLGAVEAYAILRPTLSFRALAGAALMATSASLLLRSSPGSAGSVVPRSVRDEHLFDDPGIR